MFPFFLEELLRDAGFSEVLRETSRSSRRFTGKHMQFEPADGSGQCSLYCEGVKSVQRAPGRAPQAHGHCL